MRPTAPKPPAARAQPSPAVGAWSPDTTAATSMTSAPTGTDRLATDRAWLRRLAAPPRKSALPYKTAAASANMITMTRCSFGWGDLGPFRWGDPWSLATVTRWFLVTVTVLPWLRSE